MKTFEQLMEELPEPVTPKQSLNSIKQRTLKATKALRRWNC